MRTTDRQLLNLLRIPEHFAIPGIYSLSQEELVSQIVLEDPNTKLQYHSLDNIPQDIVDKLFLKTNLGFYFRYIQIILKARKLAKSGNFCDSMFLHFSLEFLRLLESFGGRFHITGIHNIVGLDTPVVFAGNHMSVLETFVLPAIIGPQKKLTFVVKDSLVNNTLFGDIMKSRDPIALARLNPREDFIKVMEEGLERLQSGISVAIFPQATRNTVFNPSEFNSIATKLAKKAQVPILPIALKTDFWLPLGIVKDLGILQRDKKIHISIGSPISPDLDGKATQHKIVKYISSELKYWGGEIGI